MGDVLRQDVKRLRTLPKFFAAIAVSFSCLSLSVLPMSKGWTQDVSSSEINSYLEKLGSGNYSEYEKASKALQKLGSKEEAASAVPALAEALKNDKQAEVRKLCCLCLGKDW